MALLNTPNLQGLRSQERAYSEHPELKKGNSLRYLLLAVLSILLLLGGLKMLTPKHDPSKNTVQVVAAGKDLPPGTRITLSSLHYLSISNKYASPAMKSSYEELLGKTTSTFVAMGDPILADDLLPMSTLAKTVPTNMRAITLRLEPEMQLDHGLRYGDYVDVLATSNAEQKKYTRTICQGLKVLLAVPKEMMSSRTGSTNDANRVTLCASPNDCERLNQAAESGKLRLVLRNPVNSADKGFLPGADERDVLPHFALKSIAENAVSSAKQALPFLTPPPPMPVPAAPEPAPESNLASTPLGWVVEMISGSKKEKYEVPNH